MKTDLRSTEDGPWCWQSKAARRRIREAFDASHNAGTALAVYDALTEIASDEGSDEFRTTHAWIEHVSGFSPRTIRTVLRVMVEIKLLEIHSPILRAPCTYHLKPIGNHCRTIGNGRNRASLPGSEEDQKKPIAGPASPSGAGNPSSKVKPPRSRNPLLDALASLECSDVTQITGSAWSGIGKALKEIRAVCPGVTPDEISRRATNYRQVFPDIIHTARGLAKWWAKCDQPPTAIRPTQAEPPIRMINP